MKTKTSTRIVLAMAFLALISMGNRARAQEYVAATKPFQTGRSPGVKVKLISGSGLTKTYILVFAPGDEIMSGLNEFAAKYHVTSAHFTAIGDAETARIGWFDTSKKMFKVNVISTQSEVTSLIGDIAWYNGKPAVHAHINLAAEDGTVRGGHLLEAFVSPTLEVIMTVEPRPMYKKLNGGFNIPLIDPGQ
jgi:predicted DNA-binding protein with PD1-like motif